MDATTNDKQLMGKILYTLLFVIAVPGLLLWWAATLDGRLPFSLSSYSWAGGIIGVLGFLIMVWGMLSIMVFGKGLPMNAYPPKQFVNKGIYALIPHPIYTGFSLLVAGVSLYVGSFSGLFVVFPLTAMGCMALVLGHENFSIRERFPDRQVSPKLFLPAREDRLPGIYNYLAYYLWAIMPVVIFNGCILGLGGGEHTYRHMYVVSADTMLSGNFIIWAILFLLPFCVISQQRLRKIIVAVWVSLGLWIMVCLLWPVLARSHWPANDLLADMDGLRPSYFIFFSIPPVVFAVVMVLFAIRAVGKLLGSLSGAGLTCFLVYLGRDHFFQVVPVVVIAILAMNYSSAWRWLLWLSEKIANSWQEWTFGPVRIINHGIYAGAGGLVGFGLAACLSGTGQVVNMVVFAFIVVITSGLWAQFIEGSEKLKRPFGFYGGLVGIIIGALVLKIMGAEVWIIIGAVSVAMPWVQALGRLRCLVNGCCHGSMTEAENGIRYFHFRSRVDHLSGLKGKPLHATPLYSILWMVFVGVLLYRLWFGGVPTSFIFGLYLMLNGLGRFVEEAFRGEPQTPVVRGLRLYQWTAMASVVVGAAMTVLPGPVPAPEVQVELGPLLAGVLVVGFFSFFAMGVDFPKSNRRFSRLV